MRDRSRSPADLSGEFRQVTKKLSSRLSNAVVHLITVVSNPRRSNSRRELRGQHFQKQRWLQL